MQKNDFESFVERAYAVIEGKSGLGSWFFGVGISILILLAAAHMLKLLCESVRVLIGSTSTNRPNLIYLLEILLFIVLALITFESFAATHFGSSVDNLQVGKPDHSVSGLEAFKPYFNLVILIGCTFVSIRLYSQHQRETKK